MNNFFTESDILELESTNKILTLENEFTSFLINYDYYCEGEDTKIKVKLVDVIKNIVQFIKDLIAKVISDFKRKHTKTKTSITYNGNVLTIKQAMEMSENIDFIDIKAVDKLIDEICAYIDGSVSRTMANLYRDNTVSINTIIKFNKTFESHINKFNDSIKYYKDKSHYTSIPAIDAYNWYLKNLNGGGPTGRLKECIDKLDKTTNDVEKIMSDVDFENKTRGTNYVIKPTTIKDYFSNATKSLESGIFLLDASVNVINTWIMNIPVNIDDKTKEKKKFDNDKRIVIDAIGFSRYYHTMSK